MHQSAGPNKELSTIVARVQEQSGRERTEKLPLYSYRVEVEDLEDLRGALVSRFNGPREWYAVEAGAYCLFAARYFCQNYVGGPWAWRTIHDALGAEVALGEVYGLVTEGLEFWGREVIRIGYTNRYLVTIACEGGLPLEVVLRTGTRLRRYFRDVLEVKEQYQTITARELAERFQEDIPKTLRTELVFELTANLIDAVVQLRLDQPELLESETPLELLDASRPGWRNLVPLQLEDNVAKHLLQGLLVQAQAEEAFGRPKIRVVNKLLGDSELRLVRSIECSPELTSVALEEATGCPFEDVDVFRLSVRLDDGPRTNLARALRVYGKSDYQVNLTGTRAFENESVPFAQINIAVSSGVEELGTFVPVGGEPLSDLPWVFRPSDVGAAMIGVGSVGSAAEEVWVALPDNSEVIAGEDTRVGEIGRIGSAGRKVISLSGTAKVSSDGDEVSIRTDQPRDEASHFWVQGRQLRFGVGGEVCFLGLPAIREQDCTGYTTDVNRTRIEWRLAGGRGAWRSDPVHCLGEVQIRVKQRGETAFRTAFIVLPADFSFRLEPGPGRREGVIRLSMSGIRQVAVAGDPSIDVDVTNASDDWLVSVALREERPACCRLQLVFTDGQIAEVSVAVPVAQAGFTQAGGAAVPADTLMTLGDLYGIQARATGVDYTDRFFIVGNEQVLAPLTPVAENSTQFELHLDLLEDKLADWFAGSTELDAKIALRVEQLGLSNRGRPNTVFVARYQGRLERHDNTESDVSVLSLGEDALTVVEENLPTLSVVTQPFWDLDRDPEPLPWDGSRSWTFSHQGRERGPWLVTGWLNERLAIRPLRMTVRGQPELESKTRFQRLFFLPNDSRRPPTEEVVADLALDPDDPDWSVLEEYLKLTDQIPPSTFDFFSVLARTPDTAALMTMRFAPFGWFSRIWQDLETLPFLWCLLPLRSWFKAIDSIEYSFHRKASLLEAAGVSAETEALNVLNSLRGKVFHMFPQLDVLFEFLGPHLRWAPPLPGSLLSLGDEFFEQQLVVEAQAMMNRKADADWPNYDIRRAEMRVYRPSGARRLSVPGDFADHKGCVLATPSVVAFAAVCGADIDDDLVSQVRQIRTFDERWFRTACASFMARYLIQAKNEGWELLK